MKIFEDAKIEVVRFMSEDVIATSIGGGSSEPGGGGSSDPGSNPGSNPSTTEYCYDPLTSTTNEVEL